MEREERLVANRQDCFFFFLSLFSAYMANVTRIAMVPAAVKGSDGLTEAQAQAVVVVHTE